MATTTPNYGWSVPTSTDLVKDGAVAIETLGDSADATVKALNPETTLGDIAYRSATANTNTRLAIGSTGNVLTVAGGVPTWAAPAGGGKVLQVVQGTTATSTTISTTTFTDTGLSASITPSSASSKILVMVAQKYLIYRSISPLDGYLQIVRGATSIVDFGSKSGNLLASPSGSDLQVASIWAPVYLDSPSTTSAITYKTQAKIDATGNSHQIILQQTGTAVMILMEIGA